MTQEQSEGRDAQGKVREKGLALSWFFEGMWYSPASYVCTNLEDLWTVSFLGFYAGFIMLTHEESKAKTLQSPLNCKRDETSQTIQS